MAVLKHGRRTRWFALGAAVAASSLVSAFLVGGVSHAGAAGPNLTTVQLGLSQVASGLSEPVALAFRTGDTRMYVVEKSGSVVIVDANGTIEPTPVISGVVSVDQDEEGLLGAAFSPDGTKLYVDYAVVASNTIFVDEYTMSGDVANLASRRNLLTIPHPDSTNHYGGELIFGPDHDLYIGVGDGGTPGDSDGNAQNTDVLLGKILRIDPTPSGSLPYTIPSNNPFANQSGKRGEIWMYGLRNPWRFSFDATGQMWVADVGQDLYEEVDVAAAGVGGQNYGWPLREALHPYNGGAMPPGAVNPVFEEPHSNGWCAIIGGYVYHGTAIPNLDGVYVFGDLCRSMIVGATVSGTRLSAQADMSVSPSSIVSFGQDANGELYAISLEGGVYQLIQGTRTVSVGDASAAEGNSAARTINFPVTLSVPATATVTVPYTVHDNSSTDHATGGAKPGPGIDYKTKSGVLTFATSASGTTAVTKSIAVSILGDTTPENDETFTVDLGTPTGGYVLGRGSGTGTILDDDTGSPGTVMDVGNSTIITSSKAQMLKFVVTLSDKVASTVTVNYAITPDTATYSVAASGGGNYGGKTSGTITFPANARSKVLSIPVWPNADPNLDVKFDITLSGLSGTGVSLSHATAVGEIAGS